MVASIGFGKDPYEYSKRLAGGQTEAMAGTAMGNVNPFGNPNESNYEKNIFAPEGSTGAAATQGTSPSIWGAAKPVGQNQGGNVGLVERMDRIDAMYQRPESRTAEQGQFLYELA